MNLFQRVRQVDAQARGLALRLRSKFFEVNARLLKQQSEFQMRDRVRGHQKLKAEQARQKLLRDVCGPSAFRTCAHRLIDEIYRAEEESSSARRWVED